MRSGLRRSRTGPATREAEIQRRPFTLGAPPARRAGGRTGDVEVADETACAPLQRKPGVVMADTWFETVAFAQQVARRRLPKPVYSALLAASEKGVTVADNVDAFAELGFAPHVIGALE